MQAFFFPVTHSLTQGQFTWREVLKKPNNCLDVCSLTTRYDFISVLTIPCHPVFLLFCSASNQVLQRKTEKNPASQNIMAHSSKIKVKRLLLLHLCLVFCCEDCPVASFPFLLRRSAQWSQSLVI